jgi:hypothetical protein
MPDWLADTYLLVPLLALGLAIWGLSLAFRAASRVAARRDRRLAAAKSADARITRVGKSYTYRNDPRVCLFLEMQVQPRLGRIYSTGSAWKIDPAHVPDVKPGKALKIKIDAAQPNTVFPDVPWAEYDWSNEDVTAETALH